MIPDVVLYDRRDGHAVVHIGATWVVAAAIFVAWILVVVVWSRSSKR